MRHVPKVPIAIIITSLLLLLASTVPHVEGHLNTPEESSFLGFRYMAGDHYQYGAFIRQTADEGRFFYRNLFTTDEQREEGSYIFLLFFLVGLIQRTTGVQLELLWELTRLVIATCALATIWMICGSCFREPRPRRLAFFFVTLSGGLSWLAWFFPQALFARPGIPGITDPVNFQWNWNTFNAMLMPLWILPLALLAMTGLIFFRGDHGGKYLGRAGLFLLGAVIWFTHPHSGNAAYLAVGFFALAPVISSMWKLEPIDWSAGLVRMKLCLPFLSSFGLVLYYLIWARMDPTFSLVSQAALRWNPTYSVFLYPVTYGLLIPLSALGLRWSGSMPERPRQFIFSWLAAAFLLSVNPFWAGAKHQYLMHLPLALFSAHGLLELRKRSPRAARLTTGLSGAALALLLFVNTPFSIMKDLSVEKPELLNYLGSAERAALKFLEAQPRGTIISGPTIGSMAPMLTGKPVYVGHWLMTNSAGLKEKRVAAFFGTQGGTAEKQAFLENAGIDYIYYGPREQLLGVVDPRLSLLRLYKQEGVTIYRVPEAGGSGY